MNSEDEEVDEQVLKFSLGYLHTGQLNSKGLFEVYSLKAVHIE